MGGRSTGVEVGEGVGGAAIEDGDTGTRSPGGGGEGERRREQEED